VEILDSNSELVWVAAIQKHIKPINFIGLVEFLLVGEETGLLN
jgi:hypothetical protein